MHFTRPFFHDVLLQCAPYCESGFIKDDISDEAQKEEAAKLSVVCEGMG
jgi:hypothetical protein